MEVVAVPPPRALKPVSLNFTESDNRMNTFQSVMRTKALPYNTTVLENYEICELSLSDLPLAYIYGIAVLTHVPCVVET